VREGCLRLPQAQGSFECLKPRDAPGSARRTKRELCANDPQAIVGILVVRLCFAVVHCKGNVSTGVFDRAHRYLASLE
jgi:hypothetical protein